jgi:hypothetical protein
MREWYRKWMLKRIIKVLQIACEEHGLKDEVVSFAGALEATNTMSAGMKKDAMVTITATKQELACFLSYMIQLHHSKLGLLTRARIGLLTLTYGMEEFMPDKQDPKEFAKEQFEVARTAADDKVIELIS